MRVAHIVNQYPALSQTFILNQIVDCINEGCEVDIYASGSVPSDKRTHPDHERYQLGKRVHYSPKMPANRIMRIIDSFPLFLKAAAIHPGAVLRSLNVSRFGVHATSLRLIYTMTPFLKAPQYDVIHCHFGPIGVNTIFMQNLGLLNAPMLTTFYGFDVHRYPPKWNKIGYRPLREHSSRILALSKQMKQELISKGFAAKRIHVHHLEIDCSQFQFKARKLEREEPPRILSIARLVPKKGIGNAVKAVAKIKEEFPSLQYHIIGDGELRSEIEGMIREFGLTGQVHLEGWKTQDEVIEYLQQAHLFLLPSITASDGDQEGTPTALIEAMAMGLPILSTFHSGIPEVVPDGEAGYLVEENDIDGLADKLRLLLNNPQDWEKMGRSGREQAEREFNRAVLSKRLIQHYREIIG